MLECYCMSRDNDKIKLAYGLLTSWGSAFKPNESLTNPFGVSHVSD